MADTITVICPGCDTSITASTAVAGKKVRCKSCGNIFLAKAAKTAVAKAPAKPPGKPAAKPAKEAAAPIPFKDSEDDDGKPYTMTETVESHRCPHCANEMESETATVCKHCGYDTVKREQYRMRKIHDQTGVDIFLWLLPGILCGLTAIGLLVWNVLYCLFIDEWVDGESFPGNMLSSGAVKMWQGVVSVFVIYMLGKFAVRRLIFDNVPPEIEKR